MPRRTTLTLDDDVACKLAEEARKAGRPFRAVVNEALRRGLDPVKAPAATARFRVKARRMGVRPGLALDSIETLLDQLEGPLRR
jgi:hypothetical protein